MGTAAALATAGSPARSSSAPNKGASDSSWILPSGLGGPNRPCPAVPPRGTWSGTGTAATLPIWELPEATSGPPWAHCSWIDGSIDTPPLASMAASRG
eukprot:433038-Alexandrium_andersonii.AAC.1